MKIMIVGDVHGEFGTLNTLINRRKPDMIIACGDLDTGQSLKVLQ